MRKLLPILFVACSFTSTFAADPPTVLVAPFNETGKADHPWIAAALHRGVMAELSFDGSANPIVPPAGVRLTHEKDALQAAVDAGKSAGAAYVIVGTYEVAPQGLIVIGQTIRVPDGGLAGAIDVIGKPRDLFRVQGEIAAQVRIAIGSESPVPKRRNYRITPQTHARERIAELLHQNGDIRDSSLATGLAVQRAIDRQRDAGTPLTLQPGIEAASDANRFSNPISVRPGNDAQGVSGNSIEGGTGLSIVNTPGNVISGGSGNIFLKSPGNFINGGAGNEIIVPAHMGNSMGITDAHVMQGGDGNYILPGAGITIQSGAGNTAGGISGNTVRATPGNTVTASPGNSNSK
jgi:TolB-like protein